MSAPTNPIANERNAQGHMLCPVCREVIRTPDLSPFVGGQRVHEKCWSSPFIELPAGEILAFDGHQWVPCGTARKFYQGTFGRSGETYSCLS